MKVISKNLFFRSVSVEDSDFIYDLRTSRGQFINNHDYTREINKNYISESVIKESKGIEYYFVISDSRENIGVLIDLNKERSIDVIITRLRKKIEEDPKNPKFLQTMRGAGYVLWIE